MAEPFENNKRLEIAFLIGVQTPRLPPGEGAELLAELRELVDNLGLTVAGSALVHLRAPTPAFLLGRGKAAELIAAAKAAGANVIILDEAISPAQQRNWE